MDANSWLDVLDEKRKTSWILPEEWKGDTNAYINDLKVKATNKQTKKFLDGLQKHLKDTGFLSDEQKSALGNVSFGGSKGEKSSSGDSKKEEPKSKTKEEPKKEEPKSDTSKEKDEKPKKVNKETGKEIKKQVGDLLGKLGGVGKELASKVDSKAVGAIEQGVDGGKSVKDATKEVVDKIQKDAKASKEAKELEKKKKAEKKKQEQVKKKLLKKENFDTFSHRFNVAIRG